MLHSVIVKIFEYLITLGIDLPEPSILVDPVVLEEDI